MYNVYYSPSKKTMIEEGLRKLQLLKEDAAELLSETIL
jgi:hypothetical protein